MRLTELLLENYGCYDRRTLTIPEGPGLTVVYGPNEAGKSTCLEAISDFLFTIPKNSTRGQFGYDGMRLGATMRTADGQLLTLKRRKGMGKTLIDEAGTPLDEGALAPILGAITRDRFETLFGLNHESLRGGGERLLHADGDIGRLIVEAGGGLRTLMSRLDAIDAEADKLFGAKRSASRSFYQALTTYEAAEKTVRSGQLSRETYVQTRKAADHASTALENLRAERRALATAMASLDRVLRVAPHLRELDRLMEARSAYADLADYPDRFAERARTMLTARLSATAAQTAATERRERLKVRIDNLVVWQAIVEAEKALRTMSERAVHIAKQRADRPNRQRDIDDGEAQLAALRRMLGLPADADLSAKLPDQAAIEQARSLAAAALERKPMMIHALQRLGELRDSCEAVQTRLADSAAAGLDTPLDFVSSQFSSIAAQMAAIDVRQRNAHQVDARIAADLTGLGFVTASALRTLLCPAPETVRVEQASRGTLQAELAEQDRLKRQALNDIEIAAGEIAALQAAGTVASATAIAGARAARQQAWTPIRTAYVGGRVEDTETARNQAVDVFENHAAEADALGDRRAREAERAASLSLAERHIVSARAALAAAEADVVAIGSRLAAREAAFEQSFPDLGPRCPTLASLLAFSEQRVQLLAQIDNAQTQQDEIAVDSAQLVPALELVTQAELRLALTAQSSSAVRVQTLQASLARHEQGHADYIRDRRDQQTLAAQIKLAETEQGRLLEEQRQWESAWPKAIEALGLTPATDPADAGPLVTEWAGARGVLGGIAQTRHRLDRMDEDEKELTADVAEVAKGLDIEAPSDCVAAAKMLMARWEANEVVRAQRNGLLPDFEDAKLEVQFADAALAKAQAELQALADDVGLASSDEAMMAAATRYAEQARSLDEIAQAERTVIDVGDKLDIATLRAEWGARDLDALRGALEEARARIAQIEGEVETAIRAEKGAEDALAGYLAETQVNRAVTEREGASAQMHLALERYLELMVARELVSAAMVQIRAEQQDPLIRRAAVLFAATTRGEFSGIETDIDDKGQPVVKGRRANGGTASVATMSDGTRDQLFLAFRLASLEHYGAATEPLPFIADDILVHFDDDRSRSTLDLLAEFGQHNQVLLFTHHRGVRALAEPLVASGSANIVELERAV